MDQNDNELRRLGNLPLAEQKDIVNPFGSASLRRPNIPTTQEGVLDRIGARPERMQLIKDYQGGPGFNRGVLDFLVNTAGSVGKGAIGTLQTINQLPTPRDLFTTPEEKYAEINAGVEGAKYLRDSVQNAADNLTSFDTLKARAAKNFVQQQAIDPYFKEQSNKAESSIDKARVMGQEYITALKNIVDSPVSLSDAASSTLGYGASAALGSTVLGPLGGSILAGASDGVSVSDDILNTPVEQLAQTSEFKRRVANGESPEQARLSMAAQAGKLGSAFGGLTGALFGGSGANRIVNNILNKPAINAGKSAAKTLIKDVVGETGEEALQNTTSNLAKLLTTGENINANNLLEGTATAAAQGTIGAGLIGSPGSLKQGVVNKINKVKDDITSDFNKTINKVKDSAQESIKTFNEQYTSEEQITQTPDPVKQNISDSVNDILFKFHDELPDSIKSNFPSNSPEDIINNSDIISNVISNIEKNNFKSEDDKIEQLKYLNDELSKFNSPDIQQAIDSDPVLKGVSDYIKTVNTHQATQKALEKIRNIKQPEPTLNDKGIPDLNSKVLKQTLDIGSMNPEGVNYKVIDAIKELKTSLNDPESLEYKIVNSPIMSILFAMREDSKQFSDNGKKTIDNVSENITEKSTGNKVSVKSYVNDIITSLPSGSTIKDGVRVSTETLVNNFNKFTQHMANKAEAYTQSYLNGGIRVNRQSLNSKTKEFFNDDNNQVYLNVKSDKSIKTAAGVYSDAISTAYRHNELIKANPNLKTQPVNLRIPEEMLPHIVKIRNKTTPEGLKQFLDTNFPGSIVPLQNNKNIDTKITPQVSQTPVQEKSVEPAQLIKSKQPVQKEIKAQLIKSKNIPEQGTFNFDEVPAKTNVTKPVEKTVTIDNKSKSVKKTVSNKTIEPVKQENVSNNIDNKEISPTVKEENIINDVKNNKEVIEPVKQDTVIDNNTDIKSDYEKIFSEHSIESSKDTKTISIEDRGKTIVVNNVNKSNDVVEEDINNIPEVKEEIIKVLKDETKTYVKSITDSLLDDQFTKAFSFDDIVQSALDIFKSLNNFKLLSNLETIQYPIDMETTDAIQGLLSSFSKGFNNYLNIAIRDTKQSFKALTGNDEKISALEVFKQGYDVTNYPKYRVLALTNKDTSKFVLNTELVAKSVIAYTDWLFNANPPEFDPTGENANLTYDNAKKAISKNIIKFWGVSLNKNVPTTMHTGVADALAASLLDYAEEIKMLKIESIKTRGINSELLVININKPVYNNLMKTVGSHRTILSNIIGNVEDNSYSIGEPIKYIPKNRLRSKDKLTKAAKNLIAKQNKIPFYYNEKLAKFFGKLSEKNLLKLLGSIDIEKDTNIGRQKSIEGKNTTNRTNLDNARELISNIIKYSKDKKINATEVPVYFKSDLITIDRLQLSSFSGQSNKIVREIFKPTSSKIYLNDPEAVKNLWAAIGRGLGVKIEYIRNDLVDTIKKEVYSKYSNVIYYLRDNYFNNPEDFDANTFTEFFKDKEIEPLELHALFTLAELNSLKPGDNTVFETNLDLEIDGKNNGIVNMLMNFSSGEFTQTFLNAINQGGVFIGSKFKSLADLSQVTVNDIYGDISKRTNVKMNKKLFALNKKFENNNDNDSIKRLKDFYKFIADNSTEISLDQKGVPVNNRNSVKGHVIQGTYGGGLSGMSDDVVTEVINNIYNKLDSGEITLDDLTAQLDYILGTLVDSPDGFTINSLKQVDGYFYDYLKDINGKPIKNKRNFYITKQGKESLHNLVKTLYINSIKSAITEVTGSSSDTLDTLNKYYSLQSVIANSLFKERITTLLNQKRKSGEIRSNDFLSINDLNGILKEIDPFLPKYSTKDTVLSIAGISYENNIDNKTGVSIKGPARTASGSVATPKILGVETKPYLNIALGDGSMVQIYMNTPNNDTNVTLMFDGINFSLDNLADKSKAINKAVYETWTNNKLTPVVENLQVFNNAIENVFKNNNIMDLIKKHNPEYLLKNELDINNGETIETRVQDLQKSLQEYEIQIEARIRTLKEFSMSVDQMNGGFNPFITEGANLFEMNTPLSTPIGILNETYNKKLIDVKAERNTDTDVNKIEKHDQNLADIISKSKQAFTVENVSILKGKKLKTVLNTLRKSLDSKLLNSLFNSPVLNEYKYLFSNDGTGDNFHKIINEMYPSLKDTDFNNINGVTSPSNKVVFIKSVNPEILLHELLHVGLIDKIYDHYNSTNKSPYVNALEILMKEFLDTSFKEVTVPVYNLKKMIQEGLEENTAASMTTALSEFVSWVNTNKDLIQKTKETTLNGKIKRLIKNALSAISNILKIPSNMFDAVRFNTIKLLNDVENINTNATMNLNHSIKSDSNKLDSILDRLDIKKIKSTRKSIENIVKADEFVKTLAKNGIVLEPKELQTYKELIVTFSNSNKENFTGIQDIFLDAMEKISNKKPWYNGVFNTKFDQDILNNFLALSQTFPELKKELSNISTKKDKLKFKNLDQYLEDSLNNLLSKKLSKTAQSIADKVVEKTLDTEIESSNHIVNKLSNVIDIVEEGFKDKVSILFNKTLEKYDNNVYLKMLEKAFNKESTGIFFQETIDTLQSIDEVPRVIKEFFKDIVGKTLESNDLEDMLKKVKYGVSSLKENFRVKVPSILKDVFKEIDVTDDEFRVIHNSLLKTDIFSNNFTENVEDTINVLGSDSKISSEISKLEKGLTTKHIQKSKQLARYLNTGFAGKNLLTNATAIANLLGENISVDVTNDMIKQIDKLVSLYAFQSLNSNDKNITRDLIKRDKEGMRFLANYMKYISAIDEKKVSDHSQEFNAVKGFTPAISKGNRLILANDTNQKELTQMGFTRVGDYNGPNGNFDAVKKGYYYSNIVGSNYNQGALQTVSTTVMGISPDTGKMIGNNVADYITDVEAVKKMLDTDRKETSEEFIPIFDKDSGEIIAYQRSLDPEIVKMLNAEDRANIVLGHMRSRHIEEMFAESFNNMLIDMLHKQYTKTSDKSKFVNIATSNDVIYKDSYSVLPESLKKYIEKKFGKNTFYIRKELDNNILGYRTPSVQDLFTGKTRLNKEVADGMKIFSKMLFGDKAFKYLSVTERGVQTVVSYARDIIRVKSVIVPVFNTLSNVIQLKMRNVSNNAIQKYGNRAFHELNTYIKNSKRKIEIDVLMQSANDIEKRKYNIELKAIEASNNRMSISSLINKGEFNIISEGESDLDISLAENNFIEKIESLVNKLPKDIRTAARYAVVDKSTTLYKTLNKSVQYGDFIAKHILYQDLLNKKVSETEAYNIVSEAFVSYTTLPGRAYTYLESIGVTHFWAYKIKILKETARLIKNNPMRALMYSLLNNALPIGIGTPITDNMLVETISGDIKHSIGPDMVFEAHNLNPWIQIMN